MITDERVKELIKNHLSDARRASGWWYEENRHKEIADALTELLSLRSQKKRLIEDGERLAKIVTGTLKAVDLTGAIDGFMGLSISRGGYEDQQLALFQHRELLKELE